jgi:hypothetical protein
MWSRRVAHLEKQLQSHPVNTIVVEIYAHRFRWPEGERPDSPLAMYAYPFGIAEPPCTCIEAFAW